MSCLLHYRSVRFLIGSSGEEMKSMPNDGLYPLATLVRPVALRFKFHFEGDRQTNRLDKVGFEHRVCMIILKRRTA